MKTTALIALLGASALLAACSGESSAGKNEFKKAVNEAVQKRGVCLPVNLTLEIPQSTTARSNVLLGEPVIRIAERNADGERINKRAFEQIEVLEDNKFYKKTSTEKTPLADGKNTVNTRIYTLTDKGREQTQSSPQGSLLCIGKLEVKEINWYTEPTPSNGVTISKVSYQAEFKPERWTKKLLGDDSNYWKSLADTRTQTATLVKTNDGWRDIHELY